MATPDALRPGTPGRRRLIRIGTWILAFGFLILGILGLFLPILQGILFLVVSAILFVRVSPRARLLRQRLRKKYPDTAAVYDDYEGRARTWLARRFGRKKDTAKNPPLEE